MALDPTVQVAIISTGGTVALALVGILAELLRRSFHTIRRVRYQVENDHSTNLREDLDGVAGDLREVLALTRSHTESINLLHRGLNIEREERLAATRRLDSIVQTAAHASAATVAAVIGGTAPPSD